MLKVLVADDEQKVCQLIQHLINWEEAGFKIIGFANDGESALNFMEENPVDLLITDIRMPGYNGLELISKVKELDDTTQILIISGHSQFEYAHQAIKLGVSGYLLKPLKKRELLSALARVAEEAHTVNQDKVEKEHMKNRIQKDEIRVKRNLIHHMLSQREEWESRYSIDAVNSEYHSEFSDGIYQVAIIKPLIPFVKNKEKQINSLILSKTLDIVQQELEGTSQEMICNISKNSVYCVFNGTKTEISEVHRKFKKVKTEISQWKEDFSGIDVFISLGTAGDSFDSIAKSLEEAEIIGRNSICRNVDGIMEFSADEYIKEEHYFLIDNKFKTTILKSIEVFDLQELTGCLFDLKDRIQQMKIEDGTYILQIYLEILDTFNFGVRNYGITLSNEYSYEEMIQNFELYKNLDEMFESLREYIIESLREWGDTKKQLESKPIRQAKQYINEKYYMPLSLEEVSSQVGFNPAYFSTMFKKEAGMNFLEYLISIRIQQAKRMLLESDDSIAEITEVVGYNDLKYFSKLFKKTTGLTPSEFRKLYR